MREIAFLGGGEKAIEKQTAMGKMTAGKRIIALLDSDSFHDYEELYWRFHDTKPEPFNQGGRDYETRYTL